MSILGTLKVLLSADTGNFAKDLKKGQSAVSGFKTELSSMAKGMVGAFTVGAVVGGIKDVINTTAAYAKQVEDLSRNLGVSTEEASKMIQITDDLEISQGALEMGMKNALRQGITPNIEGMKDLAREYQALPTPAEKAAFAIKTFGKNGLEMAKILEKTPDQIQEMADALEGSARIMNEDAVQAAKDYRLALDDAQDGIMDAKIALGNELLPVVTKSVEVFNEGTHAGFEIAEELGTIADLIHQRLSPAYAEQVKQTEALNNISHTTPPNIRAMNQALEENAEAADGSAGANHRAGLSIIEVTKAAFGKEAMDALTKAYQEGTVAEEEYEKQLGYVMTAYLGLPAEQAIASLAVRDIKEDLDEGKISTLEAYNALLNYGSSLQSLDGVSVETSVITYHKDIYTSQTSAKAGGYFDPGTGSKHARGADFVIPDRYPNDSYPLGWGSSGERVTITPAAAVKKEVGAAMPFDYDRMARAFRDVLLKVM